uniref:Odorant receptor n=1 Tax=Angiostrongylus cantonensis TaxID=6313 RepID=A0A0K0DLC5_ANGCA
LVFHPFKDASEARKIESLSNNLNVAFQIAELFICNERCIQAGIGYIPSVIMLLSFSISFIKNCLM